jgi:hypothetical protein
MNPDDTSEGLIAEAEPPTRAYPLVDARCTHLRCPDENVYRMVGRCSNCGSGPFLVLVTARHEKPSGATCPKCGCYTVRCDRLAEDDETPDGDRA